MIPNSKGRMNGERDSLFPANQKKSFKNHIIDAFNSIDREQKARAVDNLLMRTLTLLASIGILAFIPFLNKVHITMNAIVVGEDLPYAIMPMMLCLMLFILYGSLSFFITFLSRLSKDVVKPIFHEKLFIGIAKRIKPIKLTGKHAYLYLIALIAINATLYVGGIFLGFGDVTNTGINPDFSKGEDYFYRLEFLLLLAVLVVISLIARLIFEFKDTGDDPIESLCAVVIQAAISFSLMFSVIKKTQLSLSEPISLDVASIAGGYFAITVIAGVVIYGIVCTLLKRKPGVFDITFKSGLALSCYFIGLVFALSNNPIAKSAEKFFSLTSVEINGNQFSYRFGGLTIDGQDNHEAFFEAFDGNNTLSYQFYTKQLIPHSKGQVDRVVRNIANYSLTANKKLHESKGNLEIIKQDRFIESSVHILYVLQLMALEYSHPTSDDFFKLVIAEKYQEAVNHYVDNILNGEVDEARFNEINKEDTFKLGTLDIKTTVALLVASGMASLDTDQIENQNLREKVIELLESSKLAYETGNVEDGDITKEEFETVMVF